MKIREDIHDSIHCKQRAHDVEPLELVGEIGGVANAGEECVEDQFVCCGKGRGVYVIEKGVDFELEVHFDLRRFVQTISNFKIDSNRFKF